jgi:hypothetical protein
MERSHAVVVPTGDETRIALNKLAELRDIPVPRGIADFGGSPLDR